MLEQMARPAAGDGVMGAEAGNGTPPLGADGATLEPWPGRPAKEWLDCPGTAKLGERGTA